MKQYKHVLVPLELSSHSIKTLDAACELAKQHNAKLSIIHVLDPIPASWIVHSSNEYIPDAIARVFGGEIIPQTDEEQVMQHLTHLCSQFGINNDNLHLCMGDIQQEIVSMAKKLSADVIVIGYHHTKHLNPLTHSIAQGVLENASCDVVAIAAHNKEQSIA